MAAAGLMPRSSWQLGGADLYAEGPSFTDNLFFSDPVSDHENRIIEVPVKQSTSAAADSVAEKTAELVDEKTQGVVLPPTLESDTDKAKVNVVTTSGPQPKKRNKNIDFERDYDDDFFVLVNEKEVLHSVALRLKKLQSTIGYGNFNIVSFDDAIKYAKRYSNIGAFSTAEIYFIEKIFATNAADYGFYGEKVVNSLTSRITSKEAFKVPYTGHYLLKEESLAFYKKIRKNVGDQIILTSGIRSNVKQLYLFLGKVIRVNGNLSRASRSLAPPGYSYHGIGDFDVGRMGWGGKNFTDAFAKTDEFKRMRDLGYVDIRYEHGNKLGVRFEPWHIKVV
ncbi:hypothetical protein AB835_09045 [Candidatus Endobugula sertula]|uniref:D-alanyl-D-alanine carboxypeptidase-like core domain-containing protein n=1 Tax=Candidatus Endobugula sertula TaxID=62101 RepID=A0A1D2QPB1_9GAMM|nr:hypothetical protein AB835_09045 [Candidatus Endobugula sertula]